MIEGLKIDVSTVELRNHLQVRIAHHKEREGFYAEKASGLETGGAEAMQYTNGDPIRALREKQNEHKRKSELFIFLQEHLVTGETYRLEESDLQRLEIISGRMW